MGEGLGPDNWKFICHAVRAIFKELYALRRGGERKGPAGQVWSCLRCFKLQKELLAASFTNHEIVQKVLYQHLKTDVVLKTVYDKDMDAMKKKFDALETKFNKINTKKKD